MSVPPSERPDEVPDGLARLLVDGLGTTEGDLHE